MQDNIVKYYLHNWKTQTGKYIIVKDLGFVSYKHVGSKKILRFKIKGVNYHGEYRNCELKDGTIKKLLFRKETKYMSPYVNKDSVLESTPNGKYVNEINLLMDSPQEVELNVINKNIFPKRKSDYVKALKKYIKMYHLEKRANSATCHIVNLRLEIIYLKGEKLRKAYKKLKEYKLNHHKQYKHISNFINPYIY